MCYFIKGTNTNLLATCFYTEHLCGGAPLAFEHEPGTAIECLSIPIILHKETGLDPDGRQVNISLAI
jgi:hypothetical protein